MSIIDPVPPVPQHTPPIDEKDKKNRFENNWMQWFLQLRDKINVINRSLLNLSQLIGGGFASQDADGNWYTRVIQGTAGEIIVENGDGIAGDPTISIDPSFVGGLSLNLALDGGDISVSYDDEIDDPTLTEIPSDIYDAGTI